jgi:hypothetical protein
VRLAGDAADMSDERRCSVTGAALCADRRVLAFHVDGGHAILFDDGGEVVLQVADAKAATTADKEVAIAKYSKAVAQCKAMARKKSTQVVASAFAKVQEAMGIAQHIAYHSIAFL